MLVNDVHSRLNATDVDAVVPIARAEAVAEALATATSEGQKVAVSGGRHAMGGQQFAAGATLLDMRPLKRMLAFDTDRGLVEVEGGMFWTDLVAAVAAAQRDVDGTDEWGIAQKQTGADDFSIGGSVSANAHGRGLTLAPLGEQVEALRVAQPDGSVVRCSRSERPELFSLVLGGYGLFGVIVSVTLRLVRRTKLERVVRLATAAELPDAFAARISDGYLYGDFQFDVDSRSPGFLQHGVLACYRPVDPTTPIPSGQRALSREHWGRLLHLAHTDKGRAFDEYAGHYLATSGQLYWSDLHQLADYVEGYHDQLPGVAPGTEMIQEMYVPRHLLPAYLAAAATELRARHADVIYGTVRLIERDTDSFLPWAREPWACVVLNLHTAHDPVSLARTAETFRALIDLAIGMRGSYYLTYSRWPRTDQLLACYPEFPSFLRLKQTYDPGGTLTSDWFRAQQRALAPGLVLEMPA